MSMYIYPYKPGSASAKALAKELGARRIKNERSRFRPSPNKVVINWGSTQLPNWYTSCKTLNNPISVCHATNKLAFFQLIDNEAIVPKWTNNHNIAIDWCREGRTVVCRTILNGHSGQGIVIAHTEDQLVDAPLYIQYIKKKEEYRAHVMNGRVFDVQQKARVLEHPSPNWEVRNLANGFIYKRQDVSLPDVAKEKAVQAVRLLGLDFGAVDLIYNAQKKRYYVLEVNTAPGLDGTTLVNYAHAFRENYG